METYKFIEKDKYEGDDDVPATQESENDCKAALQKLLDTCAFISTSYGVMYSRSSVKEIGNSLRGPVYVFKNNMETYHYNITGGWAKE